MIIRYLKYHISLLYFCTSDKHRNKNQLYWCKFDLTHKRQDSYIRLYLRIYHQEYYFQLCLAYHTLFLVATLKPLFFNKNRLNFSALKNSGLNFLFVKISLKNSLLQIGLRSPFKKNIKISQILFIKQYNLHIIY